MVAGTAPLLSRATLMIKPVGALCNLRCSYCYYLPTLSVFGREKRMGRDTLEAIFAGYLPHAEDDVIVAWQGGEPTLAGREFFEKAIAFQRKHARPGQTVRNTLQTNGTLVDDLWASFFKRHGFLIGISIDGVAGDHDRYRCDARQRPTHAKVVRGLKALLRHGVETNVLCVLNDQNVKHPVQVYDTLLGYGADWLQFIPAIEWVEDRSGSSPELAAFSPRAEDYGAFMCTVFDRWFERDRDRVSVRHFDSLLSRLVDGRSSICTLGESCAGQLTVEHNGDVFGCDHYVQRDWQLGRISGCSRTAAQEVTPLTIGGRLGSGEVAPEARPIDSGWLDRVDGDRLMRFSDRKQALPDGCRACRWLELCFGGCPKHRPHRGEVAEATVLCAAYRRFNEHAIERLSWLAEYVRVGAAPPPPGSRWAPGVGRGGAGRRKRRRGGR